MKPESVRKLGHVIANCLSLRRTEQRQAMPSASPSKVSPVKRQKTGWCPTVLSRESKDVTAHTPLKESNAEVMSSTSSKTPALDNQPLLLVATACCVSMHVLECLKNYSQL